MPDVAVSVQLTFPTFLFYSLTFFSKFFLSYFFVLGSASSSYNRKKKDCLREREGEGEGKGKIVGSPSCIEKQYCNSLSRQKNHLNLPILTGNNCAKSTKRTKIGNSVCPTKAFTNGRKGAFRRKRYGSRNQGKTMTPPTTPRIYWYFNLLPSCDFNDATCSLIKIKVKPATYNRRHFNGLFKKFQKENKPSLLKEKRQDNPIIFCILWRTLLCVICFVAFTNLYSGTVTIMGIETASGNKSRGSSVVATGSTGPNSSKNPPANPPVRQFANQLQQDIEDVTVEVNIEI